jgi:hypothetical protein
MVRARPSGSGRCGPEPDVPPHLSPPTVPAVSSAGPSTATATGTRRSSVSASAAPLPASLSNPKSFKKTIDLLFQSISNHRSSSIFQVPIRANEAPDYHDIVYRPMDLRTIKGRIRDGQISTVDEFERDVMLMFANALMYNDPESDVYQRTEEVRFPLPFLVPLRGAGADSRRMNPLFRR